ncbi:MAG: type III polyketide synthase [Cyclobacteriaceae bacterium]|nr:type III polyketide synthase [Cyclobacteriaceae bacterium]MCH8516546.1 type III polyketide synthase [Cyclobacteriaceae bacterium]
MSAYITSLVTQQADYCHQQDHILAFMKAYLKIDTTDERKLRVLYRMSGIKQRYSVLPDFDLSLEPKLFTRSVPDWGAPDTQSRQEAYDKAASKLAIKAVSRLLSSSHVKKEAITHLICVSCTGMSAPGIDFAVIHKLGLSQQIQRQNIFFMGCYAAFPAMRQAADILARQPDAKVVIVDVELCTLHLQHSLEDDDLLSGTLFADGAAALLVESTPQKGHAIEICEAFSAFIPDSGRQMAWDIGNHGYKMKLSGEVPATLKAALPVTKLQMLEKFGLARDEDINWLIHPGGKRILQSVAEALNIEETALKKSYEVLSEYGNMSSVTILFLLKKMLEHPERRDFSPSIALGFGPGLSLEAMKLKLHS